MEEALWLSDGLCALGRGAYRLALPGDTPMDPLNIFSPPPPPQEVACGSHYSRWQDAQRTVPRLWGGSASICPSIFPTNPPSLPFPCPAHPARLLQVLFSLVLLRPPEAAGMGGGSWWGGGPARPQGEAKSQTHPGGEGSAAYSVPSRTRRCLPASVSYSAHPLQSSLCSGPSQLLRD